MQNNNRVVCMNEKDNNRVVCMNEKDAK